MIASVPDAIFVVAGYGVILGGIALYAVTLVGRLATHRARRSSLPLGLPRADR